MADQVQFRGGTTTENANFTGANREITVDDDKNTIVIHDGVTSGGFPLPTTSEIIPETTTAKYAVKGDFFTGAGPADLYTATEVSPLLAPLTAEEGMEFRITIPATNTAGAQTIDPWGTGAIPIKLSDGSTDPVAGDQEIGKDSVYVLRGTPATRAELQNPIVSDAIPVNSVFGRTGAVVAVASDYDATEIDFDNTSTGLAATETQAAIDEIFTLGHILSVWCAFDSVASSIIDGLNASSITDGGVGLPTVNFTTNLANADYSLSGMALDNRGVGENVRAVGSVGVTVRLRSSSALIDTTYVSVQVAGTN